MLPICSGELLLQGLPRFNLLGRNGAHGFSPSQKTLAQLAQAPATISNLQVDLFLFGKNHRKKTKKNFKNPDCENFIENIRMTWKHAGQKPIRNGEKRYLPSIGLTEITWGQSRICKFV
jgi:hypothetical protein